MDKPGEGFCFLSAVCRKTILSIRLQCGTQALVLRIPNKNRFLNDLEN